MTAAVLLMIDPKRRRRCLQCRTHFHPLNSANWICWPCKKKDDSDDWD